MTVADRERRNRGRARFRAHAYACAREEGGDPLACSVDDDGADLLQTLRTFKNCEELADVTLIVSRPPAERVYRAHRFVLAMRSEFFRTLLFGSMREGKQDVVRLPGFSTDAFEVFLAWCYGDKISITLQNVQEVLYVADAYCVEKLKALCGRLLFARVDAENALEVLQRAEQLPECGLADRCLALIRSDLSRQCQLAGFAQLGPRSLLRLLRSESLAAKEVDVALAVRAWCAANGPSAWAGGAGGRDGGGGGALVEELWGEVRWELLSRRDVEALARADEPRLLPPPLLAELRAAAAWRHRHGRERSLSRRQRKVLVLYHAEDGLAEARAADVAASLAAGAAAAGEEPLQTAAMNAAEGVPAGEELRGYAGVLFFLVDRYPVESGALAASLEDFVADGGALLVCPFAFDFGRSHAPATALIETITGLHNEGEACGRVTFDGAAGWAEDPTHPALAAALKAGLDSGPKGYRARLEEHPGTRVLARWSDGGVLLAERPAAAPHAGRVVSANLYPVSGRLFPDTCWPAERGAGAAFLYGALLHAMRGPSGGERYWDGEREARLAALCSAGGSPRHVPHTPLSFDHPPPAAEPGAPERDPPPTPAGPDDAGELEGAVRSASRVRLRPGGTDAEASSAR